MLLFLLLALVVHAEETPTSTVVANSTTAPRPTKRINIVEQAPKVSPATLPAYRTLKAKVPPANYSGPAHLKPLIGACFHSMQGSYVLLPRDFSHFSATTTQSAPLTTSPRLMSLLDGTRTRVSWGTWDLWSPD